jgi:hypothetical protein
MGHPDQLRCVHLVHVVLCRFNPCHSKMVLLRLTSCFSFGLSGRKLRLQQWMASIGRQSSLQASS